MAPKPTRLRAKDPDKVRLGLFASEVSLYRREKRAYQPLMASEYRYFLKFSTFGLGQFHHFARCCATLVVANRNRASVAQRLAEVRGAPIEFLGVVNIGFRPAAAPRQKGETET